MSRYSGRCDVYDDVFRGVSGWGEYFQAFEKFKEATRGVLHQERKVLVSEDNLDYVCKLNPHLTYSNVTVEKTGKDGSKKEALERHYIYWDKEYASLKALNKKGVYVMIDIPFENVLDLVPYYPYVIAAQYWSEGTELVILANESEPDHEIEDRLESGWLHEGSIDFMFHYKHELQEHYREVVTELNDGLEGRTHRIILSPIDEPEKRDGGYVFGTNFEIDANQPVEWLPNEIPMPRHWTSPKRLSAHEIWVSAEDLDEYLKSYLEDGSVCVKAVEKKDYGKAAQNG